MFTIVLTMAVLVALALAVTALVVVGMLGHGKDKAPTFAHYAATAARHLNGDGTPTGAFSGLTDSRS